MIVRDYICVRCGERFEQFENPREPLTSVQCSQCGSEDTRRVPSAFAIVHGASSLSPQIESSQSLQPMRRDMAPRGGAGIRIEGCENVVLQNNTVSDCPVGISVKDCAGTISDNQFRNVGLDVLIDNSKVRVTGSESS